MANITYAYDAETCESVVVDFTVDTVGDVVAVFLNGENKYLNTTTALTDSYTYTDPTSVILPSTLHEFKSVIATSMSWNIANEDNGTYTIIATVPSGTYIIDTSPIPDECSAILFVMVDGEKIALDKNAVHYISGTDIKLIVEHTGFSWDDCIDAITLNMPLIYSVYFEKDFVVYPICQLRAQLAQCLIKHLCECREDDCCGGDWLYEQVAKFESAKIIMEDGYIRCAASIFDEVKNCLAKNC